MPATHFRQVRAMSRHDHAAPLSLRCRQGIRCRSSESSSNTTTTTSSIDPFATTPRTPPRATFKQPVRSLTDSEVPQLQGEAGQAWESALQEVASTFGEDIPEDERQKLLKRAFGWGSQVYWRGHKVDEVPVMGQVATVLEHLQNLGIVGPNLLKVLKLFPEVIALSMDTQNAAVAKLQGEFKLQGDVLMRAIVRKPQILGYEVDCEGSCVGDCNRCWVRF